ncbi:tripartite tricarboxylate transporter substrate binding protein [Roseococcus sp. SYP-B2431]|uniref:Bug family tripartite tricarboxylate transporter substrate binding protein n=1 Tax=Roseococcus sp. SYP-B2431 TaxID=2496640 RepID=UPI001F0D19E7|nr:tripartite tricarboxylate transporter substrate binding protein [Roseococcus sp. SYP-B2431]
MLAGLLCLCALVASGPIHAQEYPTRPIRYLVPWGAGGITDTISRLYNERVSAILGQPIVHEYRPGAAGRIGTGELGRAAPDGYTIGMVNAGQLTIHPNLYARLPYDPDRSFVVLGMMGMSPMALAVPVSSPVRSVADLRALSQRRSLNFGTAGIAGPHHLAVELLRKTGVTGVPVHYRGGGGEIMAAMTNGALDANFDTVYQQNIFRTDGRYRILAVTSRERMPQIPDVPTFAEVGHPEINLETFYATAAPSAVPAPILAKLVAAYAQAAQAPEIVAWLREMALTNVHLSPAELAQYIREWRERWRVVIEEQNIRVQ